MCNRPLWRVCVFLTLLNQANGQLHLITGTATPKRTDNYDSTLLRISDEGRVEVVSDLVKGGIEWISVSYDASSAVVISKPPKEVVTVLDLKQASVVKRCETSKEYADTSTVMMWLSQLPVHGAAFQRFLVGSDRTKDIVLSTLLDSSLECSESVRVADGSDVRYLAAHGSGGIAGMGAPYSDPRGTLDADGRLQISIMDRLQTLDLVLPLDVRKAYKDGYPAFVSVSNSSLASVAIWIDSGYRRYVFRKDDSTWRRFPVDELLATRGFGRYIAAAEGKRKGAAYPESAGRAEWRKSATRTGPDQEEFFDDYDVAYRGRLHLYDSQTAQLYTIVTNQGDSEIILVEDGQVYYRVSDKVYAAPIGAKALGTARLMAKGDEIRDAHWAFFKQ